MADDDDKISPDDEDDFIEFLAERNVREDCELCSSVDWNYHLNYKNTIPVFPFAESNGPIESNVRVTGIMMICKNCGNTRFFGRHQFSSWQKRKNVENPDNE